MNAEASPKPNGHRNRWRSLPGVMLGLSFAVNVVTGVAFWRRPDALATLTITPAWMWPLIGMAFVVPAAWFARRRKLDLRIAIRVTSILWCVFFLLFVEEVRSLTRGVLRRGPAEAAFESLRERGLALRVVTLNCGGGSPEAAAEVAAVKPDIVLLQEQPGPKDRDGLARKLFGSEGRVFAGAEASIIARWPGEILPLPKSSNRHAVAARLAIPGAPPVCVASLRLMVPPLFFSFLAPSSWVAYRENRDLQRRQLAPIVELVARHSGLGDAAIIGGDFNAPQGDAVPKSLDPWLRDAFADAGTGLGNTIINDLPVLRIDQVWASRHLRPVRVRAIKTVNSDHRMVVSDFQIVP